MNTQEMSVTQAMQSRRAVKWFDPEHHMRDDEFQTLMESALWAPTAFNIQNWRFVRVVDTDVRRAIRVAAWDQSQVTEASELLVLCFDTQAWDKQPERYWCNAPPAVREFIVPAIQQYYQGRESVQRDEGMRSCGLVAMGIMLLAKEMGYDSCPMDGFDYDAVAKIINLPEDHEIALMIAIGKKTQDAWPKPGQLPLDEVLVSNGF